MLPPYAPIDCDRHDELELLCMRGAERLVRYHDGQTEHEFRGRCRDLRVAGGAEYLVVEGPAGRREVRLDTLVSITPWH